MNNSYYINTGKSITYTTQKSSHTIKTTNNISTFTFENNTLMVFGPTQLKTPVNKSLFFNTRSYPLSVIEAIQYSRPDQTYLNRIDFYPSQPAQQSLRQGVYVTSNNKSYSPAYKGLL
jgi:hypothetical protein